MDLSSGMRAVRSRATLPRYPCGGRAAKSTKGAINPATELNGEKCNKVDTDSAPCTPRDGCGVASGVLAHPFTRRRTVAAGVTEGTMPIVSC